MATSYLLDNPHLLKGVKLFRERIKGKKDLVIQQSDILKDFLLKIQNDGLKAAYEKYDYSPPDPFQLKCQKSEVQEYMPPRNIKYDVIIVGAGMAGLAAAYELKREGLKVKILEQTDRYGGRVFSYDEKNGGLAPGLYGEAGAMRLPGALDEPDVRPHFLTDGYVEKFGIPTKKFLNYDANGLSIFYGLKEKTTGWEEKHFNTVWPDWKKGIKNVDIEDIGEYYKRTTGVVTDQLIDWLKEAVDIEDEIAVWQQWLNIWSKFTLEGFLRSSVDVIRARLKNDGSNSSEHLDFEMLENLLPWSEDAVRGYSVFTYAEELDVALDHHLRYELGQWWTRDMHTLVGGMHSLPNAFLSSGQEDSLDPADLELNQQVYKISYYSRPLQPDRDYVSVTCYASGKNQERTYKARAVIVTTQVNILRQITFEPINPNKEVNEALRKNIQAIEDIFTGPSTKIILQTKTRFWEKKKYGIEGGLSRTNLPIGQVYYIKPDPQYLKSTKQGIMLIYTWKNEAVHFGSLTNDQAEKQVIEQVAKFHPEIEEKGAVEKCIVHAWNNQPSYQGAYAMFKPTQYNNLRCLWDPMGNVHFAGENLSFTNAWIQGALESSLKSAYQVYARYVERNEMITGKGQTSTMD
ncbi:L-amino-acid oxidase-like [Dendronephthya gigantea]|uniref:L-amino-acid oxidase-like n=1 Tax=Dendronephthya gigantea TaxID=151771 RepID=UPI00106D25A3|nr:L-amino-acid oxidase-like [Dendronephthya gigantea]